MANLFYEPGDRRAEKVSELFGKIAPRYDLINDLQSFGLHRCWKRRLIDLSGITAGAAALDICCGTGDIAFGIATRGGKAVGIDFSEPMLHYASRRNQAPGGPGPNFLRGDAQLLPFGDNSFEVVTVGYGLRNLGSWERGLQEMARVVRPGGRILILDFGKPESRTWRTLYFAYLRFIVPIFGLLFCGSAGAYSYILESLLHYPAQEGIARAMRDMRLGHVKIHRLIGGVMTINSGTKL